MASCLGDFELYPTECDKALEADTSLPYPTLLNTSKHVLTSESSKQNRHNEETVFNEPNLLENMIQIIFAKPDADILPKKSDFHFANVNYCLDMLELADSQNEIVDNSQITRTGILHHFLVVERFQSLVESLDESEQQAIRDMAESLKLLNEDSNERRAVANVKNLIALSGKIECVYVITLLLSGKIRKKMGKKLKSIGFLSSKLRTTIVSEIIKDREQKEEIELKETRFLKTYYRKQYHQAKLTLQQQYLRLINTIADHQSNKYWMLSAEEAREICGFYKKYGRELNKELETRLKEADEEIELNSELKQPILDVNFIKYLVSYHVQHEFQPKVTFWLDRAIEGCIRPHTPHCTEFGLQMLLCENKMIEKILNDLEKVWLEPPDVNLSLQCDIIQGHCDLLAEIIRFNCFSYLRVRTWLANHPSFSLFSLIHRHLVDANMLLRSIILSSNLFFNITAKKQPKVRNLNLWTDKRGQTHDVILSEKAYSQIKRVIQATDVNVLCPSSDYQISKSITDMLVDFRQFSSLFDFLIELIGSLHAKQLTQENVSCLNTGIVILVMVHRNFELLNLIQKIGAKDRKYVTEQKKDNWLFSMPFMLADTRNTELDKSTYYAKEPVSMVLNMIQLLTFWKHHYYLPLKKSDCNSLVQGTAIGLKEWSFVVEKTVGMLWHVAEDVDEISVLLRRLPKYKKILKFSR